MHILALQCLPDNRFHKWFGSADVFLLMYVCLCVGGHPLSLKPYLNPKSVPNYFLTSSGGHVLRQLAICFYMSFYPIFISDNGEIYIFITKTLIFMNDNSDLTVLGTMLVVVCDRARRRNLHTCYKIVYYSQ